MNSIGIQNEEIVWQAQQNVITEILKYSNHELNQQKDYSKQ